MIFFYVYSNKLFRILPCANFGLQTQERENLKTTLMSLEETLIRTFVCQLSSLFEQSFKVKLVACFLEIKGEPELGKIF